MSKDAFVATKYQHSTNLKCVAQMQCLETSPDNSLLLQLVILCVIRHM